MAETDVAPGRESARPGAEHRRLRGLRWPRLDLDERAALGMWAAAHLALLTLAWAAAWTYRATPAHAPLTAAFSHWDVAWLVNIAQHGYFSGQSRPHSIAFFPGYPVVLAAAHLILRNWTLSGLAVSGVAGCFAVVSLTRLAGSRRAVAYLLTMPAAVFLMLGYTECLFLALAIPAWRAATRGRWRSAVLLSALAGLVRPTTLFLVPALAVMALCGPRGHRLANAARACLGFAGPLAYELYLTARTDSWNAWRAANQAGWDLHLVTPLSALKTTWWAAFRHPFSAAYAFEFQLELAAVAVMVLAALLFALWRRWPETVYCALAAAAVGTQTWYQTGPRTLLLLFPVCVAVAQAGARHPWVRYAWFGVLAPLAAVVGLLFLAGQWAG